MGHDDERGSDLTFRCFDGSVMPVAVSVVALPVDEAGNGRFGAVFTDRRDEHRTRKSPPWTTRSHTVMLSVADTGTGMPPRSRRAFELLFTTKAPDMGTGLGLSQVYTFAKRCGGFVTIETSVGQGTRVLLFLPRSE